MARDVYTGVLSEGQWKFRFGGKHVGPFATRKEATTAAVDLASKAGGTNPDGALVRVQGINNKFRTEWTYSKAPHPIA